jgi:hypothetical protein
MPRSWLREMTIAHMLEDQDGCVNVVDFIHGGLGMEWVGDFCIPTPYLTMEFIPGTVYNFITNFNAAQNRLTPNSIAAVLSLHCGNFQITTATRGPTVRLSAFWIVAK